jgi:cephalosporin hydroxylase
MNVSEVELAHRVQQFGAEKPLLRKVVGSDLTRKAYRLAQSSLRRYRDLTGPAGRFEWDSPEELADEAIRRGAMQKHSEFTGLLDVLTKQQPRNILEVGTAHGGTFFALAHVALDHGRLASVDLPGGDFGGGYTKRGKKRIESYVLPTQQLELLQADSHDPDTYAQVVDWLEDEPLDFLMIDGDHSRDGVRQDWETYGPLVGLGGMVAFHDVAPHEADPRCQVSGLWQDIKPSHNTLEFIEPPTDDGAGQWGGIGVVFVE